MKSLIERLHCFIQESAQAWLLHAGLTKYLLVASCYFLLRLVSSFAYPRMHDCLQISTSVEFVDFKLQTCIARHCRACACLCLPCDFHGNLSQHSQSSHGVDVFFNVAVFK